MTIKVMIIQSIIAIRNLQLVHFDISGMARYETVACFSLSLHFRVE